MVYETTDNDIKYNMWISGPQGARFELFPVIGKDKPGDIDKAKSQLYREQDVVKIYVLWITEQQYDQMNLFVHPIRSVNSEASQVYQMEL